jgi:hypothetical protein
MASPNVPKTTARERSLELLLETVALWAFRFSWLIKGETRWKDVSKQG